MDKKLLFLGFVFVLLVGIVSAEISVDTLDGQEVADYFNIKDIVGSGLEKVGDMTVKFDSESSLTLPDKSEFKGIKGTMKLTSDGKPYMADLTTDGSTTSYIIDNQRVTLPAGTKMVCEQQKWKVTLPENGKMDLSGTNTAGTNPIELSGKGEWTLGNTKVNGKLDYTNGEITLEKGQSAVINNVKVTSPLNSDTQIFQDGTLHAESKLPSVSFAENNFIAQSNVPGLTVSLGKENTYLPLGENQQYNINVDSGFAGFAKGSDLNAPTTVMGGVVKIEQISGTASIPLAMSNSETATLSRIVSIDNEGKLLTSLNQYDGGEFSFPDNILYAADNNGKPIGNGLALMSDGNIFMKDYEQTTKGINFAINQYNLQADLVSSGSFSSMVSLPKDLAMSSDLNPSSELSSKSTGLSVSSTRSEISYTISSSKSIIADIPPSEKIVDFGLTNNGVNSYLTSEPQATVPSRSTASSGSSTTASSGSSSSSTASSGVVSSTAASSNSYWYGDYDYSLENFAFDALITFPLLDAMDSLYSNPSTTTITQTYSIPLGSTSSSSSASSTSSEKLTYTNPNFQQYQNNFVQKMIDNGILETAEKLGTKPEYLIAQAALETGWGQSDLFEKYNNIGGVKAFSDWNGKTSGVVTTKEFDGTKSVQASFRAYSDLSEGINDFGDKLSTSRYNNALSADSAYDYAYELAKAGYTQDTPSSYASQISKIANSLGSFQRTS